jgi:hypothetical protein
VGETAEDAVLGLAVRAAQAASTGT